MYVRMYVYMYVCMYARVYVRAFTASGAHPLQHVGVCVCMYVRCSMCVYVWT
jgi:hypothetical protein